MCHYGASHLQDLVSGPEPAIFRCCPFLVDFMDDDGPLESEQTRQNISAEQEEFPHLDRRYATCCSEFVCLSLASSVFSLCSSVDVIWGSEVTFQGWILSVAAEGQTKS